MTTLASKVLTHADVMDGVADMVPRVQLEVVFEDGVLRYASVVRDDALPPAQVARRRSP